jgi:hypothetical protein
MCHDPLSQKFSFAKENMGYAKRRKEKKSMLKSMREKKRKENPC